MGKSIDPPKWLLVSNGINALNEYLPKVLGDSYGGPSLSYDSKKKEFVLYAWYDAPVFEDDLARGATLQELLVNYGQSVAAKEG